MKRLDADGNPFRFQLAAQEMELLIGLLSLYPVAPAAFHKLNGDQTARVQAAQVELEEALTERKAENQRQLHTLLQTDECLQRVPPDCTLTLTSTRMNWLLEVLNEVRVGSWLRLGQPDSPERLRLAQSNEANLRPLWAMELSGYFQTALLEALHPRANTDAAGSSDG